MADPEYQNSEDITFFPDDDASGQWTLTFDKIFHDISDQESMANSPYGIQPSPIFHQDSMGIDTASFTMGGSFVFNAIISDAHQSLVYPTAVTESEYSRQEIGAVGEIMESLELYYTSPSTGISGEMTNPSPENSLVTNAHDDCYNLSSGQSSTSPSAALSFPAPLPLGTDQNPSAVHNLDTSAHRKRRTRARKKPQDLKKNKRKVEKPEQCHICTKGHPERRDLERHMVSNHRPVAKEMGLDVSKVKCNWCEEKFDNIRRDRLTKHIKNIHPNII